MTITIEKKQVYAFLGIVALLIVCLFFYRSCSKADYETTAKDMKINARIAISLAADILSDYQKNWNSSISDHHAVNEKGESTYCSDFNEAISWRYLYYSMNGYINILDSISNVVKEDMKVMEDTPSKFKESQKSFLELYNDMNSLVSLVKNPKGSLMSFGQNVNEIMMDAEKRYNETDLKISIEDSELNNRILAVRNAIEESKTKSEAMKKKAIESAYQEKIEKNKVFLENKAKEKDIKKLESGVLYRVIKEGAGAIPKETSMVKIHYEGKNIDGKVFDSSFEKGQPVELRANQVIKGFTDALVHMPVGSTWEVYIPANLAYGERQAGEVDPFSIVIFKIELLKIVK